MPLDSRQDLIATAIRDTLMRDLELREFYTWRVRKLAMHRGAKWASGAYVVPMPPQQQPNETQIDRIDYRFVAAIVNPVEPSLEQRINEQMGAIERVEDIFRSKSGKYAPDELVNLTANTASNPDTKMAFQISNVEPAERFIAGAFSLGYDASACMIVVRMNQPRRIMPKLILANSTTHVHIVTSATIT